MIRVGIELHDYWQGGINYDRNLIRAIHQIQDRTIEPVLLMGTNARKEALAGFPDIEVIRTPMLDRFDPRWIARKVAQQSFMRDPFLERLLRSNHIDVLSHSDSLGSGSRIPSICWIPDFQHIKMPHLFQRWEKFYRNRNFRNQVRNANIVVLSSFDSQAELEQFEPRARAKIRVLHFVAQPDISDRQTPLDELAQKYSIEPPYFHVPNQFWSHKNHGLILDALHQLKVDGDPVTVVATGPTEDYRRPKYFGDLMAKAHTLGVDDCFRVLGLVPFDDLMGIMHNAVALINPSFFEGWSTSVEEAKSLGKRMILSDIAVHREQNPPLGIFVDPNDALDLADAIRRALNDYDHQLADEQMRTAREALPSRVRQFGERYQSIVLDAFGTLG